MTGGLGGLLARALDTRDDREERADRDSVAGRILDAALHQVAAVGVRRTTVDDIARRAGVGRVTVFRRFTSRDNLLGMLAVRECRRFLAAIDAATANVADPADRVVESFVAGLRLARGHPLLDRLARIEPETVLSTLAHDRPPVLSVARDVVARRVLGVPGIDAAAADRVAEAMLRIAVSFLLLPRSVVDLADDAAVRDFARRTVAPMLRARP